jgi:hypothetical protein
MPWRSWFIFALVFVGVAILWYFLFGPAAVLLLGSDG